MNKLNLIIPMVGGGKRFRRAGYDTYKPFIKIHDKYMIDYVMDPFPSSVTKYIVTARELLSDEELDYLQKKDQTKVIFVDRHVKGPGYSILQAKDKLPLNEAFFFSYCDIAWTWDFNKVQAKLDHDGVVFTHRKFHPHLVGNGNSAFCKPSREDPEVLEQIKEKGYFTDDWMTEPLSVGAFYVKRGHDLMDALVEMVEENELVNQEFFPSLIFNRLIQKGMSVGLKDVDFFIHWGLPSQLEDFNRWQTILNSFEDPRKPREWTNVCTMGGLGSRLRKVSPQPKALIPLADEVPMFKSVADQFGCESNVFVTTGQHAPTVQSWTSDEVFSIGEQTNSQFETILKAKEAFLHRKNFFLSCCDGYGHLRVDFPNALEKDADCILFTFQPSLLQTSLSGGHYTYVSTKDSYVTDVHIKNRMTENDEGLAGFYFFRDGQIFRELDGVPTDHDHEMCSDHFVKHLVAKGYKVVAHQLPHYVHLGTPEELQEFWFWLGHRPVTRSFGLKRPVTRTVDQSLPV